MQGNQNWMRAREAMLDGVGAPRHRAGVPDLHARRLGHGPLRRGARAAPPRRPPDPPRRADDDPRGVGEQRRDGPRPAGVLPLPLHGDGAVGRPGQRDVHRRHGDRRRARPQRPAPEPLLGHRRRPRRDGVGGRRHRHRPGQGRHQGPPAAGPHVPHRHRPGPHRRRRGDQDRRSPPSTPTASGCEQSLVELDDLPDARARRVQPRQRAAPPAAVRLHPRGAQGHPRPDGAQGHRAARLDGHRHADRRAVGPARGCCSTTSPSSSPRSPTRRSTPSARRSSRRCRRRSARRPTCCDPGPESCRQLVLPFPIIDNDELAKIVHANDDGRLPRPARRTSSRASTASPAAAWRSSGRWRRSAARCRRRSTTGPGSSCCPTATPTRSRRRSRRCC